jgi:hypothetical protein
LLIEWEFEVLVRGLDRTIIGASKRAADKRGRARST